MPKDEGVRRIDLPIRRSRAQLLSDVSQQAGATGKGKRQHFACFCRHGEVVAVTPPSRSAPPFVCYRYPLDIKRVIARVVTAPTGDDIDVNVYKNEALIATVTILDGTNDSNVVAAGGLVSGDYLDISVTSVGSTIPGYNLTVQVELWGDVF